LVSCARGRVVLYRRWGRPPNPFSAALGLTAALGFLVRVSVLCVLAFHVQCLCAAISISLSPVPFYLPLSFSLSQRAPVLIRTHAGIPRYPRRAESRFRTKIIKGVGRFAHAAPRERAAASRCCFGGPALRRRRLALENAQCYQRNHSRSCSRVYLKERSARCLALADSRMTTAV
jgi:hypothetical protein